MLPHLEPLKIKEILIILIVLIILIKKVHVAQARNINSVTANKLANPHKIKGCGFFYDSTFYIDICKNYKKVL